MKARWAALGALLGAFPRRDRVLGINRRNLELVARENASRDLKFADDKLVAKQVMTRAGVPVAETLAICDSISGIARVLSLLEGEQHFAIKPACSSMGKGILVVAERVGAGRFRRAGGGEVTLDEIGRHLADIVFGAYSSRLEDRAFVERRIEPHAVLKRLWADGLSDFRVLTLRGRPFLSMLRVPTARSGGRANLHRGGVGLAIDHETGVSTRAVIGGKQVLRHPDSSAELLGIDIPAWSELLGVAARAAKAVPLGYLGVDLVLDATRGPLVLEINARPGLEIQNVHGCGLIARLPELAA